MRIYNSSSYIHITLYKSNRALKRIKLQYHSDYFIKLVSWMRNIIYDLTCIITKISELVKLIYTKIIIYYFVYWINVSLNEVLWYHLLDIG